MSPSTSHTKDVTIPLLLVVAGIVLTSLAPSSETLEKFLLSYLKNKSLVLAVKALVGVTVCLLPYYFLQKSQKKVNPLIQDNIIKLAKENCHAKYNLRKNELRTKFDSIISDYAARGFPLLPGMANKDISDLYLNELRAFSEILTDAMFEVFNSAQNKIEHQPFIELSRKLIMQEAAELETSHSSFLNQYFKSINDQHLKIMKESFREQINHEATLNISKISSQIEIKFMV